MDDGKRYEGPERRRHKLYVTRNTEYHLRDGVCVAVRDRRTGRFRPEHAAVNHSVSGGLRLQPNGVLVPTLLAPEPGEAMLFMDNGCDLVTSVLCSVERPSKVVVASYPS